jgi:adenosylmethionine-8-amino-7-oxononanoate aminotransferase
MSSTKKDRSMSHVLHRSLGAPLPLAVRGEGCYLFDREGRRYLDASGGAAVSCLGHSHPRVIQAVIEQLQRLPAVHTSFFTTEPMERLADFIIARAPAGMSRMTTVSDGSVAVEVALKLSRQYWIERGEPSRRYIVSRRLSYHGNTLGALAVSGNLSRREPYAPLLPSCVEHIGPCYAYREKANDEPLSAYGLRAANELEAAIARLGPENVAAFIAEPVVGATAGCLTAAPGYFKRIREICEEHEVLFIADEIMSGMGRTGTLFACEQEAVVPDIITIAKGLGGGYQPIGATIVHEKIISVLERGSRALSNGHTYMGHPVACAAALATQEAIEEEALLLNVRRMGALLEARLRDPFGDHPNIGDIRGRGLFWAMELVEDRATKAPFDPRLALHARIKDEALRRGLLCYPSGGTADGVRGDHILFAPPYILGEAEVDTIAHIIEDTLAAVLRGLPVAA